MKSIKIVLLLLFGTTLSAQSPQNWNWTNNTNQDNKVSLILLGDTNIQNREDPTTAFQYIMPTLQAADMRFCNLEGTFAGTSPDPNIADIPHKFSWKHSDPAMVEGMVAGGFEVVGVANNVTYPYTALQKSLKVLDKKGIQYVGGGDNLEEAHRPVIIEKKGTKIGFLQYACTTFPYEHAAKKNQPGIAEVKVITSYQAPPNWDKPAQPALVHAAPDKASLARMEQDIKDLKAKADIVVVSYHWGVSNTFDPVDYQKVIGRTAIESGADIIFGHGPHKIQAIEMWKERPIFYSVGNSVFDWWKGRPSLDGLLVRMVTNNKKLEEISFVPLQRNEDNDPILYNPNSKMGQEILKNIYKNKDAYRARLRTTENEVVVYDANYQESIPSVEKVWQTDGFKKPESAVYDPQRKVIYISNLNEDAPGDGFISKMDVKGNIQKLGWIDGLDNPKGMDMQGNYLYVNDQHRVLKIDVVSGEIVKEYPITGAVFLNDLAVDEDGTIYTVDSDGQQVFQLKNGKAKVFWQDRNRGRPNGIWLDQDRILLTTTQSNQLIALDKILRKATVLQANVGTGDGIEALENGGYLVTDFQGRIFYFSTMENLHTLLDIRGKGHTADLEYIAADKLIIVPMHRYNGVQAYKIK